MDSDGSGCVLVDNGCLALATIESQNEDRQESQTSSFVYLPTPRTHDISPSVSHVPNIEHVAHDIGDAVRTLWPTRHESRYTIVDALLVGWEYDDLGVDTEIKDLGDILRDLYGYDVQSYKIPSVKPDRALKKRVLEFLDRSDGDRSLMIFYYAGHATKSLQSNEAPIWVASRDRNSASLPSGGIQSLLEEADADVLLLYDCCHSAAIPTKGNQNQKHGGVTKVLAACGFETVAPEVDQHSFTKALIETLALASNEFTFTIPELHCQVLSRIMCWTPGLMKDPNHKFVKDSRGRLAAEPRPRRTPIYSMVSASSTFRSIILAPLSPAKSSPATLQPPMPTSFAQQPPTPLHKDQDPDKSSKKRKRDAADDPKYPQILISIRLDNDDLDCRTWVEYLRLLPPEAKEIKVEGVYQSFSTLLVLRLPIAVWDLLPENPAYTFIGFVTSDNISSKVLELNTFAEGSRHPGDISKDTRHSAFFDDHTGVNTASKSSIPSHSTGDTHSKMHTSLFSPSLVRIPGPSLSFRPSVSPIQESTINTIEGDDSAKSKDAESSRSTEYTKESKPNSATVFSRGSSPSWEHSNMVGKRSNEDDERQDSETEYTSPGFTFSRVRHRHSAKGHGSLPHLSYNPSFRTEDITPGSTRSSSPSDFPDSPMPSFSRAGSAAYQPERNTPTPKNTNRRTSVVGSESEPTEGTMWQSTGTPTIFTIEEMTESDVENLISNDVDIVWPYHYEDAESDREFSLKPTSQAGFQDLKFEDIDCKEDADLESEQEKEAWIEAMRARKRRARWSSGSAKRTISQSIGSDTDDDDLIAPQLDANEAGSSARRLRRKTNRASLIFDDPSQQIDELEEPDSCEEAVEVNDEDVEIIQELPYWGQEMDVDSEKD